MLTHLTIHNIALIDTLSIPFAAGLNALTGETGAGKSIILDALSFALGAKPQPYLLRGNASQGSVIAEFSFDALPPALQLVLEKYALPADTTLLFRRLIFQDGKHKAFINDVPMSLGGVRDIASQLVEYHGQHDHLLLTDTSQHRTVLDQFAQLHPEVAALRHFHQRWQSLEQQYHEKKTALEKAIADREYLRHAQEELAAFAPEADEETALITERATLLQLEKSQQSVQQALTLAHQGKVDVTLHQLQKALQKTDAEPLQALAVRYEHVALEFADITAELERCCKQHASDSSRLEALEDRLFGLRDLARKYQQPTIELAAYLDRLNASLAQMQEGEETLHHLQAEAAAAKASYLAAAMALSEKRQEAAKKLTAAVVAELEPLKMGKVAFVVACAPTEHLQAHGMDHVQFLVRTNASSPLGPLNSLASGGELSRLMLAVKCVLSQTQSIATLIFDEVDSGIGGATADAVGQRLSYLGKQHQVIVVTHQPQVAALATHPLKVAKYEQAGETMVHVSPLSPTEHEEEIARMLSGATITHEARAAAKQLLVHPAEVLVE